MGLTRNQVCPKGYRGFKSPPLRTFIYESLSYYLIYMQLRKPKTFNNAKSNKTATKFLQKRLTVRMGKHSVNKHLVQDTAGFYHQ